MIKTPSILVVDDEPNNFDVIETFLSNEDYTLYYASNGNDAIASLENEAPDLILLDVMMPELDGLEVCRQIKDRQKWKAIPIIMVTALNSKEDLANCLESGADDFIGKPVNSVELKARIKSMLRMKTQYDEIQKFSILQRNTINTLAKNMDELTGNIAISLSHELNTPLNGVVGILQILKTDFDKFDHDEMSELLGLALFSADRLVDLTKRFLLYLQLELSGTTNDSILPQESVFSLSIVELIAQRCAKNYDRIEDIIFDIEEAEIAIAENYLLTILSELIDNAFKFSVKGSPVTISSRIQNHQLHIIIHDGGKGMTPEQISKIGTLIQFERETYSQQGVGIGLKLVKMIIKKVNGVLEIKSIYRQETKVMISLPIITL
ncbi:hybrid sensor histidine kinase/response regulator [Geminocystis sp. NIES-3709]|uniref:hybrid sensor histidine kinase/response regulator n=1 Tax=Geminocystis sp. NIES-3709 TaxID=1617448 RepID=UPI0005FCA932|nr:hybrid sensor histidine kinase/response regulator [Geminocystis sp. NIES-3709]BAQ66868.1 two-component response regulator SA14-24 [Geminocystis sp. NIES-3709]